MNIRLKHILTVKNPPTKLFRDPIIRLLQVNKKWYTNFIFLSILSLYFLFHYVYLHILSLYGKQLPYLLNNFSKYWETTIAYWHTNDYYIYNTSIPHCNEVNPDKFDLSGFMGLPHRYWTTNRSNALLLALAFRPPQCYQPWWQSMAG